MIELPLSTDKNQKESTRFNKESILENIRNVIELEAVSLDKIVDSGITDDYFEALLLIYQCKGKVLLTGVGKSGLIAKKIAATMASTGTLALFLHPTEAMHGDLGILNPEDIVLAIGKSGESDELSNLLPAVRHLGAKIVAMTSNRNSTLADQADVTLYVPVEREACPLDLAPTVSTTVMLAIGDALAISLMKMKRFRSEDFARFHPGGSLGKRLLYRVSNLMIPKNKCPILHPTSSTIEDVIYALGKFGLGIVLFSNDGHSLYGVLTDGDIRRLLNKHKGDIFQLNLDTAINKKPLCVSEDLLAIEALRFMEERTRPLNVVPVTSHGKLAGVARLHELVKVS